MKTLQRLMILPIRVVDTGGRPIPGVHVEPWALRDGNAHILWRQTEPQPCLIQPEAAETDAKGIARLVYPFYCDLQEATHTTSVSVTIDHPKYACVKNLHIEVPLEENSAYEVELARGVQLELCPIVDGVQIDIEHLYAHATGGRWFTSGSEDDETNDGVFRISAMPPGQHSIWISRVVDAISTHFSDVLHLDLTPGEPTRINIPLFASRRIHGQLSDNVPRPIRSGVVVANSLSRLNGIEFVGAHKQCVIKPDGTFVIDGWPQNVPLQIIALCDGFMAKSGSAPDLTYETDNCIRPQVFDIRGTAEIELEMTQLVSCTVTAVNEQGIPLAGIHVLSFPNVQWFDGGADVYCGENDQVPPHPFHSHTDHDGHATLKLPAAVGFLSIDNDQFELPTFLGDRWVQICPVPGGSNSATLRLQLKGKDFEGDWDLLVGFVSDTLSSGDTPSEACERLRHFSERFRTAENQLDPQLLFEAYTLAAEASAELLHHDDAERWRKKAADEAAKAAQ